ncbi:MAG: ribosomal protein S18-alanine N-acetyltransferase [Clostridiales bacterium]|nr:ribosomal protein S18-alanine N-acetyltransferase [Clostridiales bacterium]
MGENIQIRPDRIRFDVMRLNDIPEVAAIERQTFSQPWTEAGFRSALEQGNSLYLTARAEDKEKIVGYCGFQQAMDEAELLNVAVRGDARGNGIGYRMLRRLLQLGRERGVRRFVLEVRKSNAAALRLYEKLGFVIEGERKNFYERPNEDAVIMSRQFCEDQ